MKMVTYIVITAILFAVAMATYLHFFLHDGFGLTGGSNWSISISIAIAFGIFAGLAAHFAWLPYFVIIAVVLALAQWAKLEKWAVLPLIMLIACQLACHVGVIIADCQAGNYDVLKWVFSTLVFPLGEIALYWFSSTFSAEIDARRSAP